MTKNDNNQTEEVFVLPKAPEKWKPKDEEERCAYFNERVLDKMGLTIKDLTVKVVHDSGRWGMTKRSDIQIMRPSENGGVTITLYDIDGQLIEYERTDLNKIQKMSDQSFLVAYEVERINPKNVDYFDRKYVFPTGQATHPFFPPKLVEKFKKGIKIPMLVLTEGYFKAMCGSMHGFDIVGLGSITHYAETGSRRLHRDISRIIDVCQVKSVVVLYDGDCINISEKDLNHNRELTRRPSTFFHALLNTRDLLRELDVQVYFAHVLTDEFDVDDPPKGLDDLLMHPKFVTKRKDILKDLEGLSKRGEYFYKTNITGSTSKLQGYFYLKDVEQFYTYWKDKIGEKEFTYYGTTYKYDASRCVLDRIIPRELKNFMRAGDDYYEKVKEPSPLNPQVLEDVIKPRRKGTIIDDFGKSAIQNVTKYKGFVYIPMHKDFQQVINNFYNRYYPLRWTPENRAFPHIEWFMKHIFGPGDGSENDQLQLGYDYFQIMYLYPKQILPILCAVSKERGTGKTSLLTFVRLLFGENVAIIDNNTMVSEFNSIFAGRLAICIDESSFGDNGKVTEKLKNLSTAPTMALNEKGKDQRIVANFCKFILTSNEVSRFVKTDAEEVRFWVREIDPIPPNEVIPDIKPFFEEEIPGFLYFLNSRQLSVPEAITRMWFTKEQLYTKALANVVNDNRPQGVKDMAEKFKQMFLDFPESEYMVTVDSVRELVPTLQHFSADIIRKYLKDYFLVQDVRNSHNVHTSSYVKLPYYIKQKKRDKNGEEIEVIMKVGYCIDKARAYTLDVRKVLNGEDLEYVLAAVKERNKNLFDNENNNH